MGFALKKAFARTIHIILPDLRTQARSYSKLTEKNLSFWIFINSNGIYAVGKMGCTILALAKTIVFSAFPSYSFTGYMSTS